MTIQYFQRVCTAVLLYTFIFVPSLSYAGSEIEEAQLSNGLRVLLIESHNVPMVAMQLLLPAGSRFDEADKAGTASMLASMLGDHTKSHQHDDWAVWLDSEAVRLGAGASRDTLTYSITVLKEVLPAGLDMLAESLLQPGWDSKRFKVLQQDAIASAIKAMEVPGYRAGEVTSAMVFGDHPYGHRTGGTVHTLKRIKIKDIKDHYRAQCKPQGAVLAVSGDITMQALLPMLEARLQTWQGKPKIAAHEIDVAEVQAVQQQKIAMPTTQMLVQFSRLGIARSNEDFFPVLVMNHLLGGSGFGSVLMEEVREKRGLVYGIYSYVMPLLAAGPFVITLQTKADQADQAAEIVRQVLSDMASGHIDSTRVSKMKDNLIGGFAQRMDSNRERVGLVGMIGFYQLPLNYLQVWTKRIKSVTLADVKRTAKKYLQPKQWNILRVGPVGEKK